MIRYIKILYFLLMLTSAAKAQSQGPFDPGTSGTNSSVGSFAWSNTVDILSSDNSRAKVDLDNNGDISNYVTATNFGFTIPVGATIDGIVVDIERSDNGGSGNIKDNIVKIIKAGTITGTDKSAGANWPSSDATKTYGTATDLWGTTWTVANINASTFGVAISAKRTGGGGNNRARIDNIQITVYYTVTLPVELLYFTATSNNTGSIKLEWATATETNNDCFVIEKASDNIQFAEIERVKGSGNSSVYHLYSFIDNDPLNGTNYYRMVQIDFNGVTKILPIVSCEFNKENSDIIMNVFDISGKLIYSCKSMFSEQASVIRSLQLHDGIYIIQSTKYDGTLISVEKYLVSSSPR